jgi:perosamine synthetase
MIRLGKPSIDESDITAISEVLRTGFLVQGAKVEEFENSAINYINTKFAIAVNNCTTALHLSLLALDIRPGDIVLVTTYSWVATANVIELCGATPVFVDIDPLTFNMDPGFLEDTLARLFANKTVSSRVKCIIPVHTFGLMADMQSIMDIADRYHLPVIEDAACAYSASLNNKYAGSWGTLGCFSFHPRKSITTGEGGMIATNDELLAKKLRALRNHGIELIDGKSEFTMPGFNYRLTEFQAAFGLVQLSKLGRISKTRKQITTKYKDLLAKSGFQFQQINPGYEHVYQSFIVLLPDDKIRKRDEIIRLLKEKGIEVQIGTWHMPLTQYFRMKYHYKSGDFPNTDKVFASSLSLPLHELLTDQDIDSVCSSLLQTIS